MALFEFNRRDGIQFGGPQDLCYKCEAKRKASDIDSDIPYGKLEYQEVFKFTMNSIEYCMCMEHFKEMCETEKYTLVDKTQYTVVPNAIFDNEEEQEEPKEQVSEPVQEPTEEDKKKSNKSKK